MNEPGVVCELLDAIRYRVHACHSAYERGNSIWLCTLVMTLPLASLVGCNSQDHDVGIVKGTVTVDGQPPSTGAIAFTPVDGMSPTAGSKIVDGRFESKVAIGTSSVAIRVPKVIGERKLYDTSDSPTQPILEEVLPAKYNDATELRINVTPGENVHNFDLSSG
jgi:hypothetical protein